MKTFSKDSHVFEVLVWRCDNGMFTAKAMLISHDAVERNGGQTEEADRCFVALGDTKREALGKAIDRFDPEDIAAWKSGSGWRPDVYAEAPGVAA